MPNCTANVEINTIHALISEFNLQYMYDTIMDCILRVISPKLENLKGRLCFLENC